MTDLLKRWTLAAAFCASAALIGCGPPGDLDDDGENEPIENVSPSPPGVPSTDMDMTAPGEGDAGMMTGEGDAGMMSPEATAPGGTGAEAEPAPSPEAGSAGEPEVTEEPETPGADSGQSSEEGSSDDGEDDGGEGDDS